MEKKLLLLILFFLLTSISLAEVKNSKIITVQNEFENTWTDKFADIFRIYTGADVTDYGQPGLPRNISLLGLSNYHTLIKLDGRIINSVQDGNANLNQIPASLIKSIEIKRGLNSAADEANILGGVVNIISREPLSEIPYTRLYSRWGTSGMEVYGVNFEDRNGSLRYSISSEKRFSRGFGFYKKNNNVNAVNFYSKLDWYYDPVTWFTITTGKDEDDVDFPIVKGFENDKNKNKHIQLKYETHLPKTAFKIRFYDNSEWLEQRNTIDTTAIFTFDNNTQGNEEIIEQNIGENNLIRIGKEHHWNKFDGNFLKGINIIHLNAGDAFFYEDEITLHNLTLKMGQRYDKNSLFAGERSPRFKLNYESKDKSVYFITAGRGISFPHVNDLYSPTGDSTLCVENGWVYTLGFDKNISDFVSLNFTTYYASIKNYLIWDYDSSLGYYKPGNIPSVANKGVETGLQFAVNKNIDIQTIYTYLLTQDKETKNILPYRPKNKFKTNLLYKKIKYDGDLLWFVELTHEYQSSRYININNSRILSNFSTINLNISMKLAKAFTINIIANNLANEEYSLVDGYTMPPANYWGGIVWEFLD